MFSNPTPVIDCFQRAAQANLSTPGRDGSVIRLAPPTTKDVIVGADLHGHRLNLRRILQQADLENHPRRALVLQEVCHGGPNYPGTSACMSHLLLADIASLKVQWPDQVHFILSNHELAELIDLAIVKGNRMLNLQFRNGFEVQYGGEADRVRLAAMEFIRTCPLAVRTDNRVWVSHSSPAEVDLHGYDSSVFKRQPTDEDLRRGGPAFRLVWGRDFRFENALAFATLVNAAVMIHGHEPCSEGYMVPNARQIIIDSSKSTACCLRFSVEEPATPDKVREGIRFL